MTKHEPPPFNMVIEPGRLIPATPYDAERFDSYRRGTKVKVRFTEEKDRVLVRKWWAIIGKAVKECKTPWKTRDEASEAIKLALGIVNLSPRRSAAPSCNYPKSLTELTDPELQEAVEQMTAIIHHITGVDPDDWRKEVGDLGNDDEPNTEPSEPPHASDAGNDAAPNSVVSDPSAQAATEPGDSLSPPTAELPGSTSITDEDKDHLLAFIRRLKASIGDDETVVLATNHSFAAEGRNRSPLAAEKAKTLVKLFRAICRLYQGREGKGASHKIPPTSPPIRKDRTLMHGQSLSGFISDLFGIGAVGLVGALIVAARFVVVGTIVWWPS